MEKDDTRDRLIRVAAQELARHGYQGASLRKVATKAGIGAATVFHHFPGGKEALYKATADHIAAEVMEIASMRYGFDAGLSVEDVIAQQGARLWDFLAAKPELAAMLLRESFDAEGAPGGGLRAHAEGAIRLAHRFIQKAQRDGQLGAFDARRFMMWSSSYVIGFHGAPGIHEQVMGSKCNPQRERQVFLAMLRAYLRGEMPGDNDTTG